MSSLVARFVTSSTSVMLLASLTSFCWSLATAIIEGPPKTEWEDGIDPKKREEKVVPPFHYDLNKANPDGSMPVQKTDDELSEATYLDYLATLKPDFKKKSVPPSGDLDTLVPKAEKHKQNDIAATFDPFGYDPVVDSPEAEFERMIQRVLQDIHPYSCIINDMTSCNDTNSCTASPYLHVEPYSCTYRGACSESPWMVVGSGSCLGGRYRRGDDSYSCWQSPHASIGRQSCISDDRNRGACSYSEEIHVADNSCVGGGGACAYSRQATIQQNSCRATTSRACYRSENITVDKFSCRANQACEDSPHAIIGKYSCNCFQCCLQLSPGCVIPDFKCNGNGLEGTCQSGCPFPMN